MAESSRHSAVCMTSTTVSASRTVTTASSAHANSVSSYDTLLGLFIFRSLLSSFSLFGEKQGDHFFKILGTHMRSMALFPGCGYNTGKCQRIWQLSGNQPCIKETGSRLKYREMSENLTAVRESTMHHGKGFSVKIPGNVREFDCCRGIYQTSWKSLGESLVEEHFAVVCLKCVMQHKLRKAMENVGGNFREFRSTQRMATLEKILHCAVIQ